VSDGVAWRDDAIEQQGKSTWVIDRTIVIQDDDIFPPLAWALRSDRLITFHVEPHYLHSFLHSWALDPVGTDGNRRARHLHTDRGGERGGMLRRWLPTESWPRIDHPAPHSVPEALQRPFERARREREERRAWYHLQQQLEVNRNPWRETRIADDDLVQAAMSYIIAVDDQNYADGDRSAADAALRELKSSISELDRETLESLYLHQLLEYSREGLDRYDADAEE